jgi:uridylate kinase
MPQTFVLKLGGSIISPDPTCLFDFPYAKELKNTLGEFVQKGDKFFITVGGGHLMRQYRDLAVANGLADQTDLHWIGTTINVLNAEVVRVSMQELADPGVYKYEDYYNDATIEIENGVKVGGGSNIQIIKGIKVGGGGRPGTSGDVDSILAALKLGTKTVISLKNVDAIYTADPKLDPKATPIEHLNWKEYLDIIGNPTEHKPGASYPIDPIASQLAIKHGLKFIIIDGRNIENLKKVLLGEMFTGTMVE